jgi:ABC-type transport system involved in cytochrome c biogenesis permease subunit
MDKLYLANHFLNFTSIAYLIATLGYIFNLAIKKDKVNTTAFIVTLFGFLSQTIGLILRWIVAGWNQPPFSNLYESLIFFVWGIVLIFIITEFKYKIKLTGIFLLPIALIGMGLATLNPNKDIEPLVPALQSIWLHLHVATATFGYGAFIVATCFSILFLIKDNLEDRTFKLAASIIIFMCCMGLTYNSPIFSKASYTMEAMSEINGKLYAVPGPESLPNKFVPLRVNIPFVGIFIILTLLGYFLTSLLSIVFKKEKFNTIIQNLYLGSFLIQTIATLILIYNVANYGTQEYMGYNITVTFSSNTYEFGLLIFSWIIAFLFLIIKYIRPYIVEKLPEAERLDDYSYKTILVGFPFMTLLIITGAVWAHYAWGRYWGWDPKETWSLITWFVYAIYLHLRISRSWQGRPPAYISILGFFSVIFTYLGVNLLLSGLHSYGA